jgi:hypothetical protein
VYKDAIRHRLKNAEENKHLYTTKHYFKVTGIYAGDLT